MIKQSWNINEEERKRILNLHENATKNQYLMNEQWVKDSKPNRRSKEPLSINPQDLDDDSLSELPKMGEIPKNISFGFPLKKLGKPESLSCFTDDMGNVYCIWKDAPHKLPTIQEIGLPMFVPENGQFLSGVGEWEWLNSFNDYFLKRDPQDPAIYVPAYDKGSLSLHFLRYILGSVKRPKGRQPATEFIQADDNKYLEENGMYFIVIGKDIPVGGRIPTPSEPQPGKIPTPPKEAPVELNISNPFNFDQVTLTPEGQAEFDKFVENLKKYINYFSGNVEVITSASIDADPMEKKDYNMKLSQRRASTIIEELKRRLGETKLNFIAKPLGQTDQFEPGLKYPEVKDVNKTAPNRRLIIKLPKITVKVD